MAAIASVQAGDWNTASTWDSGTIPTGADTVTITHAVTVAASFTALTVTIGIDGSLTVADTFDHATQITAAVGEFQMLRQLDDKRTVRLDGVLFSGTIPSISAGGSDDLPPTLGIVQDTNRNVIIADPGYIGTSAKLQDINPQGCGRAYARKTANSVRYLTTTVRIRASMPHYLGMLYRLAEGPYQVLMVTDRAIIKGHIETIAPDQSAVGTEYITVRITVAEGSRCPS